MKASTAITALGALAQETRLSIFRLLVQRGERGLAAGQLSDRLGVPSTTLSFHLAHLSHSGLVSSRRQSRSIIYSASSPAMNELLAYLTENCCQGETCAAESCEPATAAARGSSRRK